MSSPSTRALRPAFIGVVIAAALVGIGLTSTAGASTPDADVPTLSPCPVGASSTCVDHGQALVQLFADNGTMSASPLALISASMGGENEPFALVYGSPAGHLLRITARLAQGMRPNDPDVTVELTGPRFDGRATGCAVTVSSVPPEPLEGAFACGERPYRHVGGGSGTAGFFAASPSQGVLLMRGAGPFHEAALVRPVGGMLGPGEVDLVYEAPWGYWTPASAEEPVRGRVEIRGLLRADGVVEGPHLLISIPQWFLDSVEADSCSVTLDVAPRGAASGRFACPSVMVSDLDLSFALDGTFTAASGS